MSVTLKHIADELDISMQSVTYALNGKPGVSEATRQRILDTAERLGYDSFANRGARVLAARRFGKRVATGAVAFAYATTKNHPWLNDPYNRALVNGAMHEAGERQLDLYLTPHHAHEIPRMARAKNVDGLILQSSSIDVDELLELKLPTVILCGQSPHLRCLQPDTETGFYLVTKHLLEGGHRGIAYIGAFPGCSRDGRSLAGYRRALSEYSLPVTESWLAHADECDEQAGYETMSTLLARRSASGRKSDFTALVCYNDLMAMGAVRKAIECGLRVPEDLSVTGFDDISREYYFQPTLTSVATSRFEIGRRAVAWICEETQRLIACDESGQDATPQAGVEYFPVELVVRDSARPYVTTKI
jgi:DNA-binding LacI/PurR family transcriptional regulator